MAKKNISTKKGNFDNSKTKKKKIELKVYHKKVDTIYDAVNEFKCIPGIIEDTFARLDLAESIDTCDVLNEMVLMFKEHLPYIEEGVNSFWQLNVSGDRCFMKTNRFIGFGWIINKKWNGNKFDITSISLTVTSYNPYKTVDEINALNGRGWELEEK